MDKKEALEIVIANGYELEKLPMKFKKDRDVVLEAVKTSGVMGLQFADKSFYKDRDLILTAVLKDGKCLYWADEKLKKDKEIVLAAIKQNGGAFEYAHDTLKKDKEIVLIAVKKAGWALEHADKSLQKDRDIVIEAVKQSGTAIEYAHPELKKDKEISLMAIKNNSEAIDCLDKSLKKDRDLVLIAVSERSYESALQFVDKNFKKDKEIVLAAVNANSEALAYADKTLYKDKDFIKSLMINNNLGGGILNSLSELKVKFAEDKEIINLAIENSDEYGITGGSWWQDRSLDWIEKNQEIVEKIVNKQSKYFSNDAPDLELKKFNKNNYIHQSAVLISKTLDLFGIKKIDPKKIIERFKKEKNSEPYYIFGKPAPKDPTFRDLCLGHNILRQSLVESFALHFNVFGAIDDDPNYFLNHYDPDFTMALDFVEEVLDDPGSSYNDEEENI